MPDDRTPWEALHVDTKRNFIEVVAEGSQKKKFVSSQSSYWQLPEYSVLGAIMLLHMKYRRVMQVLEFHMPVSY